MTTLTNAIARINELRDLNPDYTKAKLSAFLTVDDYSAKVIKQALTDVMGAKTKAVTFTSIYYAWLAEAPRTEEEVRAYILDEANSENTRKHLSHFVNIWALTVAVRESLATPKKKAKKVA